MKFCLIAGLCAVGALSQGWNQGDRVSDQAGNQGIGRNNDYIGKGNRWVGNNNRLSGAFNTVDGDQNDVTGKNNSVDGKDNSISGGQNVVSGQENQIAGEGNLVMGSGNVVSNGQDGVSIDIESRLPAWMRSAVKKGVSPKRNTSPQQFGYFNPKVQTPPTPPVPETPVSSPRYQSPSRSASPKYSPSHYSAYTPQNSYSDNVYGFNPYYKEVRYSPRKTEYREVYVTPNSRGQYTQSYSSSGPSFIPSYGYNSDPYDTQFQRNMRSSSMNLRARIEAEVQRKLNEAFSKAFF